MSEGSAQQPARRFGRSGVLGTVRSVRTQSVESRPVMKLELEPLAGRGGEPVTVSFPAQGGGVSRGDVVEADGRPRDGALQARRLFNHTTGLAVASSTRRGQASPAIFLGAIVLGVVAIVVLSVLNSAGVFSPKPKTQDPFEKARLECYKSPVITREKCDEAFKRK